MQTIDDLSKLLDVLPDAIRTRLEVHPRRDSLVEVVMDLGRQPEARFFDGSEYLLDTPITQEDLQYCVDRLGDFGGDNRAGIERTLHRISAIRNRRGTIIGLTCRVGRAVFGTIGLIRDLVESGRSILMLGRPGVGKTTALREIARLLADDLNKRVVIIDTSNEIAGDGDIPHPAIGRARRMQVAQPELQHQVMVEAVENHMPEVIVIDEIGTELEALAARTIAERGVQLVGTAHGNRIANLIKNPTLCDLIGGIQSVTLGDEEARRRGSQKSVLERKAPPTFDIAVEMLERQKWVIHEQVAETVDDLLRGRQPNPPIRTVDENGKIITTYEVTPQPEASLTPTPTGWRTSGRMIPLPSTHGRDDRRRSSTTFSHSQKDTNLPSITTIPSDEMHFAELLETSLGGPDEANLALADTSENLASNSASPLPAHGFGPNGEDLPLHIYPYGVSRNHLDQVIRTLNLPIALTKDIDCADAVLALRSHVKNHAKLRQLAKTRQLPIYTMKSNTIPQIAHTLRRLLDIDEPETLTANDLSLLYQGRDEDEIEALEETRLAVEQIVIPKGQPVELLPRSARVRKMQHELVEHYHLRSNSFGDEPNRRIRIYPA
ncbi:MAG: AAA family ATPase [Cyanobacteria bacterium]|nr:AAA family ATPase [Cyanobacteriota bacterium]MDW8201679.1 R3H domain-containing nucleic acid-binding protein [Cyanobacteriota bacterium SKYGB_h_bin112]